MVNMGELFAHPRIKNAAMDRVPLGDAEAEKFLLRSGDLLFARQSLVLEGAGKCSIFLGDDEPVTFESHVTRVRLDAQNADPKFYFYYLQSHHGQSAIRSIVEQGAGASGIRGSDLQTLEVLWHPPTEQRAIAHILGTLDDKIELNRRSNQTLEAIARALFKSWFVDFDGVPPEDMQESELGLIPKGWRASTVGKEVSVFGGSTPSTKEAEYWNYGTHHWATPKDLSSLAFPVLLDTERKITDSGLAKITSGLLPAGTLLLSSRAPIGYLAIAEVPTAINQGFIAMTCEGEMSNVFMLHWCRENMDAIVGNANGSTFLEISKSNFRPLPIVVPSSEPLHAFEQEARPLHQRIVENERQSRILAQLRDTLLPKLISGEMRVQDAESFMEAAT